MKNTFGSNLTLTLFGESHGPAIGAVLDGLAPGMDVDEAFIASQLTLRRPAGKIGTARREEDRFQILSGVFQGKTTGTPLTLLIPNESQHSGDYEETRFLARPGHADYTAWCKYHGFEDYRGGGHFSGRVTAALVAAGAILLSALNKKGIRIGTHILRCAGIQDRPFGDLEKDLEALGAMEFAALDEKAGIEMRRTIEAAGEAGDSVGGVLETAVTGLPAGLGEPWFDTVEGLLAHGLFSIPGVKGVDFGGAFEKTDLKGSVYNDAFYMDGDMVRTRTNNNGGVNGGISNGMPLLIRCAVKPTSSIRKTQETVDMEAGKDAEISVSGRHDPAIIHRAAAVADSVAALVLCDALAQRFGTGWLGG